MSIFVFFFIYFSLTGVDWIGGKNGNRQEMGGGTIFAEETRVADAGRR